MAERPEQLNNTFYATFIPGLQKVIAEIVHERLPDVKIYKLLDGALFFETSCTYDKLNFFCFNNIFAVIDVMEQSGGEQALERHIKAVVDGKTSAGTGAGQAAAVKTGAAEIIAHNSKKFRSFRIVVSNENKPAAIDEKLRADAERYLSRLSGMKVNRGKPDTEFWFLYRREDGLPQANFSLFMKRLTLRPSWEKSLHPGELLPPLAWTLCRLAGLKHGDIVLDPFCGYGSIPFAALKYFHITKCIACDTDKRAAASTAGKCKNHAKESFVLYQSDFRSLVSLIDENSVDAIVTDPPWGFYEGSGGGKQPPRIAELYDDMSGVFEKLLKKDGHLVVLCAGKEALLKGSAGRFELQKEIPVLLSGKKAGIFILKKARFFVSGEA